MIDLDGLLFDSLETPDRSVTASARLDAFEELVKRGVIKRAICDCARLREKYASMTNEEVDRDMARHAEFVGLVEPEPWDSDALQVVSRLLTGFESDCFNRFMYRRCYAALAPIAHEQAEHTTRSQTSNFDPRELLQVAFQMQVPHTPYASPDLLAPTEAVAGRRAAFDGRLFLETIAESKDRTVRLAQRKRALALSENWFTRDPGCRCFAGDIERATREEILACITRKYAPFPTELIDLHLTPLDDEYARTITTLLGNTPPQEITTAYPETNQALAVWKQFRFDGPGESPAVEHLILIVSTLQQLQDSIQQQEPDS